MTKVVNSSEYSANSIFVGCSVNEDGEPLVEINGKAIGTVDGLLEFLGKYQGQQKAKVNVKWAAAVPPDGFLGPRDYKIASPHRATAFWVDVPDGSKPRERIVMKAGKVVAVGDDDGRTSPVKPAVVSDGVLYLDDIKIKSLSDLSNYLANVEIKDAYISPLPVGSANIEGADKDAVARLQRELDDLKASLPNRVEEAVKSAAVRNVRPSL